MGRAEGEEEEGLILAILYLLLCTLPIVLNLSVFVRLMKCYWHYSIVKP